MDTDYQVHIRDKDSHLTRVFFVLLLMEQLNLDWRKCIDPPEELIEWCNSKQVACMERKRKE